MTIDYIAEWDGRCQCPPFTSIYLSDLIKLLYMTLVSDIAIFVLKRDVKLQLTN